MSTRFTERGGWPGVLGVGVGMWFICWDASVGLGLRLHGQLYGMRAAGRKSLVASAEDSWVPRKAACVLRGDILKRKCSQLFVSEGKMAGPARQLRRRALQSLDR